MPGLLTGIKGPARLRALKAHRLALYQSAYIKYLFGECELDYLNLRLNKLLELNIKPPRLKGIHQR